jgi:hypothetical protein
VDSVEDQSGSSGNSLDEPFENRPIQTGAEMYKNKLPVSLILLMVVILCSCVKPPEQPTAEQPAQPEAVQPPATEEPQPEPTLKLPTPSAAEVRNAIARIYKNAVIVDITRFIVGDFNGDGFQDLAAVVRPAEGKLTEINNEVANWILEDPQKIVLPDPKKSVQQFPHLPEPTRVDRMDILLAVLHGYGSDGWRDQRARQTYLLKNAVGNNMKSEQLANVLRMIRGKGNLPRLRGDVISEAIAGESGILYYTGAKYAWLGTSRGDGTVASRK